MAPPPILALALPSETGRVLSIQSHTVQGYVGNKSAVFPLQLLGYDVDPINSVQFSNHTGYPTFKGQVLNEDQLWDLIEGLGANDLLYYTHLLTGYIGSVSFLNTVLRVVEKLRSVNPGLTYGMATPNFVLLTKKHSDYIFVSNMERNLFKCLPSEIINNIFLRLPARTIAISKCVCQSWLDLVDKDEFVKAYFSRSPAAIAVLATRKVLNECTVFELKDEIEAESRHDHRYIHPTKSLFPHLAEVLGSANGLLLLKNSMEDFDVMYACNPITREYIELRCPEGFATSRRRATYGIGVSKITSQHKVVRIKNYSDCSHVYTLGTGLWRRVEAPMAPFNNGFRNSGAFFNGNLHWLIRSFSWISCFDLETECFSTFSVSPVPPQGIEKVSILMDCLCLCDNTLLRDDGVIVIWLMKEYGVKKSWTKEYVINLNFDFARITLEDVTPIKVFSDGDILMQWGHEVLFYYSNKTKTSRKIGVFDKGYPDPCSMLLTPIFPDIYLVLLTPSFLSLKTFEMENVKPMKCSLLKKFWGAMADWRLEFFVVIVVYILVIVLVSYILVGNR